MSKRDSACKIERLAQGVVEVEVCQFLPKMFAFARKLMPLAKPTKLDVIVHSDKSLDICWEGEARACYELEISYFELEVRKLRFGEMQIEKHSDVKEVKGLAAHVPHPESLSKACAWAVKITVRGKSAEKNDAITKQVSWDDELSRENTREDLKKQLEDLNQQELQDFTCAKGMPQFLVLGMQHHGKSSFVNHLYRCLKCDLTLNDQMDVASAGAEEKTVATKHLEIPSTVCLHDTPAFANMNEDSAGRLQALLSSRITDGARRQDLRQDARIWFSKPPHGAIVVMSLIHWRDQTDEMQKYLSKMADSFKKASGGRVAFPYVVACTHCDVFLKECQEEKPGKALQKAVGGIGEAALTKHVYPITNYNQESVASARNNKATFGLVSQLLALAKHENTAKVQSQNTLGALWALGAVTVLVLALASAKS